MCMFSIHAHVPYMYWSHPHLPSRGVHVLPPLYAYMVQWFIEVNSSSLQIFTHCNWVVVRMALVFLHPKHLFWRSNRSLRKVKYNTCFICFVAFLCFYITIPSTRISSFPSDITRTLLLFVLLFTLYNHIICFPWTKCQHWAKQHRSYGDGICLCWNKESADSAVLSCGKLKCCGLIYKKEWMGEFLPISHLYGTASVQVILCAVSYIKSPFRTCQGEQLAFFLRCLDPVLSTRGCIKLNQKTHLLPDSFQHETTYLYVTCREC